MGIHNWSKSAVLTLLVVLSIGHAHAATRKYVSMPSNGSVVNSGNGSSKSGGTLSVPGSTIEGEYIPSSYGGGSKGTKLPVKPTYDYSIPRTIKGMSGSLRGGVVGIGLSVGLQYMLDQVGGFIDESGQPLKRIPDTGETYQPGPTDLKWTMAKPNPSLSTLPTSNTPEGVCLIYAKAFASGYSDVQYVGSFVTNKSSTQATCNYQWSKNGGTVTTSQSYATRTGETCPAGYERNGNDCQKTTLQTAPLTEADYDLMEAAAAAKDSEWLKDRLRDHCEGGLSPESCYESLRDSVSLSGPASVTENGPTSTTVGPSGTTTTTNKTDIDITYGDNYYDYRKTSTVVKTNPDGTTETTTEAEPETEQPTEEDREDIEFTDSEFPAVEPFYVQKYPNGLSGVWSDAKSQFDSSQFMAFLQSFIPQFSGSCPSWSMSFDISAWANYGTQSFANLCYVFDFIKVIFLVTALFTARAITFGG
ncbi:hypothetical protein [Stutzerimonas stutzeri]|uniref:hypothetical protein n=1 Tax=Stutzerimonas stutzeri TaxID=316 RepID=UPI001BD0B512|nr:hypothetical protein [Stutzerimonas stutzeri]